MVLIYRNGTSRVELVDGLGWNLDGQGHTLLPVELRLYLSLFFISRYHGLLRQINEPISANEWSNPVDASKIMARYFHFL